MTNKNLRLLQLVVFCALKIPPLGAQITNPILNHPDPFITWQPIDGNYLLLATTGKNITIWHGATVPTVAHDSTTVFEPRDGMVGLMSPTLWKIEGHWWIYFAARYLPGPEGIYALESRTEDALGSYTFRGKLDLGRPVIDPSLLIVAGRRYLMYVSVDGGENAIRMVELAHPMQPVGPRVLITQPERPWEKGVIHNNYPVTEGPTALYHEGRTFIVYSASNTMSAANYCLGLLTYAGGDPLQARSWVKTGPVFRSDPEHGVFSPGRATFALSRDGKTYWLLYHAKSRPEITMDGRSIRLQVFRWGADGMPEFGVPRPDVPTQ